MKPTTPTWIFTCGLLAAAASTACTTQGTLAPQDPTAHVSLSTVCDVAPLNETTKASDVSEGSNTIPIRFVVYGDVDSDDDLPCGMMSNVRIAIIEWNSDNDLRDWWEAVGGNELGTERFAPPGVRVPSTAEKLSDAPAQFVTTGPEGTVETLLTSYQERFNNYIFCAISPINNIIVGCDYIFSTPKFDLSYIPTVYIYFTHGHAIFDMWDSDRYQRFLNSTSTAGQVATVTVSVLSFDDIYEPPDLDYAPYANVDIAIIGDAHLNTWWTAISEVAPNQLESDKFFVSSEILAHDWVYVTTTGSDGLAQTALTPGDYLVCSLTHSGNARCAYENLPSGHHVLGVDYWSGGNDGRIWKMAEDRGRDRLKLITELTQPVPPISPVAFTPSAVCDVAPLDEPVRVGDDAVAVRFVVYGDIDSDDDVSCGMIPDVRIAIINQAGLNSAREEEDSMLNWWTAVGGDELGIKRLIPPGVRVPTSAERLSAAPAQFVTTGSDGVAEVSIAHEDDYSLCAILPDNDLVAGCYHHLRLRTIPSNITVYTYLTHGHADIEVWDSDRYQRFLDSTGTTGALATVTFAAVLSSEEATVPFPDTEIVIIGDEHVNAWWTAVSDNGDNELELNNSFVRSEVLAHDWAHVATTGPDGLTEMALVPGDYLICALTRKTRLSCVYENIANGHHLIRVSSDYGRRSVYGIERLAEDAGKDFLKYMTELAPQTE